MTDTRNDLKRQRNIANIDPAKGNMMRAVVQRVDEAGIRIGGRPLTDIKKGILVFLGIEQGDRETDADYLSDKITHLRIFEDENGKMNLSVLDINGELLVVSQFTLFGDCRKGRRPSFTSAENPERAKVLYDYFIAKTKEDMNHVTQGEFQAMMSVTLVNSGPVTMLLDSRRNLFGS
jgi:D-tyrosyl-tRNA(Tyr) deacylase